MTSNYSVIFHQILCLVKHFSRKCYLKIMLILNLIDNLRSLRHTRISHNQDLRMIHQIYGITANLGKQSFLDSMNILFVKI